MKKIMLSLLLMISLSSCAVFMAAKQPDSKDLSVMRVGTNRSMILAEFGMPISEDVKDGKKVEIFKFVDGYSTGAKVGRAMGHGVADVLTLGLWEIIGTPTEAVFDGSESVYQVTYNDKNIVTEVIPIKK